MRGTISGASKKANTGLVQRAGNRVSDKAAPRPNAVAATAVTAATPSERRKADCHNGENRKASNQRRLKPLGGNDRNGESVNAIGNTTRIGSDSKATTSKL